MNELQMVIFGEYLVVFGFIIYIDIKHHKIYNWVILLGSLFAIWVAILSGTILNALLGGGVVFLMLLALTIPAKGELGPGDIKLGLLIGLMLGFPAGVFAVLWGSLVGIIVGIVSITTKNPTWDTKFPFGAYLAASAVVVLVLGVL